MLNGTYLEGISDPAGKVFENTHNKLYKNNGDGTFTDITETLGLRGPELLNGFIKWSVGVAFWDFNQDERIDAMVGNFLAFDPKYISPTTPEMMPHPSEYKGQATMLYQQLPNGKFKEVTKENGLLFPDSKCMGITVFDYDYDDGDLDIFQGNDHQLNFLFRNDNQKYTDVASAIGAKVIVKSGDKKQVFVNQWSTSYLSNNDPRVHIGLGQNDSVDQIEIHWTNGKTEIYYNPSIDCYLTINEGSGIVR